MLDFSKYLNTLTKLVPHSSAGAAPAAVTTQHFSLGSTISGFSFSTANIFTILILVCALLFVLSLGRTRTLISLLAIYVAFTFQTVFPFFGWLQGMVSTDLATIRVGVFILAYILAFPLMSRSVLLGRFSMAEAAFVSVIIMGIAQLGLIISTILNLAPSFQQYIPSITLPYIATQQALFYWTIVPLILLIFNKKSD